MPIVCGNCGSENRSNAKFCIGCAGRLPGFAPSGAAALQPEGNRPRRTSSQPVLPPVLEPSFAAGVRAPEMRRGVPSEMSSAGGTITSFWLNLGLVSLTMIIAFVAWCVYVLHHGTDRDSSNPIHGFEHRSPGIPGGSAGSRFGVWIAAEDPDRIRDRSIEQERTAGKAHVPARQAGSAR